MEIVSAAGATVTEQPIQQERALAVVALVFRVARFGYVMIAAEKNVAVRMTDGETHLPEKGGFLLSKSSPAPYLNSYQSLPFPNSEFCADPLGVVK